MSLKFTKILVFVPASWNSQAIACPPKAPTIMQMDKKIRNISPPLLHFRADEQILPDNDGHLWTVFHIRFDVIFYRSPWDLLGQFPVRFPCGLIRFALLDPIFGVV